MPFTLSHPAGVLPLARTRLNWPALVIGCMSPDFIYSLTLKTDGDATHCLAGIFFSCLPAGLLMLLIYHRLLRKPLCALLRLRTRLRRFNRENGCPFEARLSSWLTS